MNRISLHRSRPWFWLLTAASLLVGFLAFLFFSYPRVDREAAFATREQRERYVGFSVFGPDWPQGEKFASERDHLLYLEEQGYLVAQHTSRLYGNLIRVPISMWRVLNYDVLATVTPQFAKKPIYELDESEFDSALPRLHEELEAQRKILTESHHSENVRLSWKLWDAFLGGVQKYNRELEAAPSGKYRPVFVDLLLVERPPSLLIEALSLGGESAFRTPDFLNRLWERYFQLYQAFLQEVVRRYGRGYARQDGGAAVPVMIALEMFNEPDYVWLPDEMQIERALKPDVSPCDKYITQLHLPQIPENDLPGKICVQQYGLYQEQVLENSPAPTALRHFRWGTKFDNYVLSFTNLHEYASRAAREEIQRGGASVHVVSSAVTHVNLDWFWRMFQAKPKAFFYNDAVAIHPYHWPRHEIHDMQFVGSPLKKDWLTVSPREFAGFFSKRFDFLQALAALVDEPDFQKSYGLSGKPLWITEFGIPTKKVGRDNSAELLRLYPLAIYDRATPIPEEMTAIVWEDKWEAFLDQVSVEFLTHNNVDAFLVYTLRESAENETNDDNHSNFALYRADWSSRMAPDVLERLASFFLKFRDG